MRAFERQLIAMAKIADYSGRHILTLQDDIRDSLRGCESVETAAQRVVDTLYDEFIDSVVLVRFFATVPFAELPLKNREFVRALARQRGEDARLTSETLVLSLLGTRGLEEEWNNRHLSRGHIGIPLISASFVESIPMIARLLTELEIDLDWFDEIDHSFGERMLSAGWISFFHVLDAAIAVDRSDRLVIPDQEFVARYGIQTVFGLGGIYSNGTIMTLVAFTRDRIEKEEIEEYVPVISSIKASTAQLVQERRIFADGLLN